MSRKPEIGNVQLYPNRPLRRSDKNGYVLKFYCPIVCTRVRKNCGTRDRREARKIQRACQQRLLNGEYIASDGAITVSHAVPEKPSPTAATSAAVEGESWDDCYDLYRQNRASRIRQMSLSNAVSRLQIANRILTGYFEDRGQVDFTIRDCFTLKVLEYLQERLLAGDECRYDQRSPNTVNSMMGAVMAFVRYCHDHEWIDRVPRLDKLDADDVMKGRPVTPTEFESLLSATPAVVGLTSANSWMRTLHILWESGFRVGDVMDFSWDDDRHIYPFWPKRKGEHATIAIPSTQKNGECQIIPMLPGLQELLGQTPEKDRHGWVVDPQPIEYRIASQGEWIRPANDELRQLVKRYSNCAIATACGVSECTVRKWLSSAEISRVATNDLESEIPKAVIVRWPVATTHKRPVERLTKERVGRIISLIGEKAGIVVRQEDARNGTREKFASSHDLRRGCALRLIDAGVSAETLMVVMRHADFDTTQKFYGAMRSAQAAAAEVRQKLAECENSPLVGGLMGGTELPSHLSESEVRKLKALLASL